MNAQATHRNARISPRKVHVYRNMVIGMAVGDADAQLRFLPGKTAGLIRAVLKSAIANATNNNAADVQHLYVADLVANSGFVFKRFRPMSKGMAYSIKKRTAHITVVVQDRNATSETLLPNEKHLQHAKTVSDVVEVTPEAGKKAKKSKKTDRHEDKQLKIRGKITTMQRAGDKGKSSRRPSKKPAA
jgi:large subunit ribosomal protein L22